MPEYETVDLSTLCNVGMDIVGEHVVIGDCLLQGLPFAIAGDHARCFLGFGEGARDAPLRVPIGQSARHVIIAHRLIDSTILRGGPPGDVVAEYVFRQAGVTPIRVPIRERFEISAVPTPFEAPPWLPFLAVPDVKHGLHPRSGGNRGEEGVRQREATQGRPRSYVLWAWANPTLEQPIESIEIVPTGTHRFIVAAITLGHVDESPFVRGGRVDVQITLPRPEDAQRSIRDLGVDVDRGVATYPYALPTEDSDGGTGWGEPLNTTSSPAYVQVAATPSARLEVRAGKEILGGVRWGDVQEKKPIHVSDRLRVQLIDHGRNWVRTSFVDDATGRPVPCRVHFRSPEGVPYPPHGYHAHVNANHDTWHVDVGGDVRLGQTTYAVIDGTCEGWLPRGDVVVEAARGFEYEPVRTRAHIAPGQQELEIRLKRWRDMNGLRWFSGDTHVHFLSTMGAHAEARAEDLNVVNLLQSQWGHLFTSTEEFTGGPSVSADGRTIVYVSQENRQHLLGHLILLGLTQRVMPWSSDGPNEAELGGTLEVTLADWADRTHAQGGTVVVPHFPMPNGEASALVATGRADAAEMIWHSPFSHAAYYRHLNAGYRLPLVGGTDKMSSEVPVGLYRTYVSIPEDEEFSYAAWCRNLARGRTFLSGGPLLEFTVEGQAIGDTLVLPPGGGRVEVHARADSIFPMHTLQVVQQGRVVASTDDRHGARTLELRVRLDVQADTWLSARVGGPDYGAEPTHHDVWRRGIFAHTSPIYVACGGEWRLFDAEATRHMLRLVDGSLSYVRHMAPQYPPGTITHHHGQADHLGYLVRPLEEARRTLESRLGPGIPPGR